MRPLSTLRLHGPLRVWAAASVVAVACGVGLWLWPRDAPTSVPGVQPTPKTEPARGDTIPAEEVAEPPLRPVEPKWPTVSTVPIRLTVGLPGPVLDPAPAPAPVGAALLEPALAGMVAPAASSVNGPGFAKRLMAIRRLGLSIALLVEDEPNLKAQSKRIAAAVESVKVFFPGCRFGAVVYSSGRADSLDFGATAEEIAGAVAAPAKSDPASRATGLARAMSRAAGLSWRRGGHNIILVLAGRPPWVAEIPNALEAARRAKTSHGVASLYRAPPDSGGGQGSDELAMLTRGPTIARSSLRDLSLLGHELLALALGAGSRARIEEVLSAVAR